MIHVVDFEKTALSTSFRGVLPPSGPQISAESSMGYPLLGTRETRVVSTIPWPLFSRPTPPAPRPTTPRPAGSGRAQTLPRWLLPATDHRIGKDRTGPDLDERPLYFQYAPSQTISADKINLFLPTRRRPLVDHPSWREGLDATFLVFKPRCIHRWRR